MNNSKLGCHSTAAEQYPIARAMFLVALSKLLAESLASTTPIDPEILENMKLWEAGRKDDWHAAELKRIFKRKQ